MDQNVFPAMGQALKQEQKVLIEEGAVRQLEDVLTTLDANRILFVFDEPAFKFSGAAEALEKTFEDRRITLFSGFEINPKIEDAEKGIMLFHEAAPHAVVALGGGSAIDMAKLIAGCAVQQAPARDYALGRCCFEQDAHPLVAIPTTSGTGSEATHFAVVYVGGRKYSLAHASLRPHYVLIDPQLTASLPARATAACGLDALSQAMESIWAVGATDESMAFATEALELCLGHLERAVHAPDRESRMAMARAAHLAGKAIDISKTTAPHAFSYGITTHFSVPHGAAVALTLGSFLAYNYHVTGEDCTDPRGPEGVRGRIQRILEIMSVSSVEAARASITALVSRVGCPVRLSETGITPDDLDKLINEVNLERLSNNPRKIDSELFKQMLEELL